MPLNGVSVALVRSAWGDDSRWANDIARLAADGITVMVAPERVARPGRPG